MSSLTIGREWRLLSQDEFDTVAESHHESLAELDRGAAIDLLKRLRRYHEKYRDVAHKQRREARRKAQPTGTRRAEDNTNTSLKAEAFRKAMTRVKRHMARIDAHVAREKQKESLQRALESRRQRPRHHPGSRTSHEGMQPAGNTKAPRFLHVDREKGRVSEAVKRAQARRDAR